MTPDLQAAIAHVEAKFHGARPMRDIVLEDKYVSVLLTAARRTLVLEEGLRTKIDIDNGITSGSIGPLMDIGFNMGWEHARKIVRALLESPEQ